jgi:hypothetical protein
LYCLRNYVELIGFLIGNLEKHSTLQQDLDLLNSAESISWALKMSITYRANKKIILKNQLHLSVWITKIVG